MFHLHCDWLLFCRLAGARVLLHICPYNALIHCYGVSFVRFEQYAYVLYFVAISTIKDISHIPVGNV